MFRLLILVHRYLGIAIGLIVALWCLSGFVMMYVQYPDVTEREYLASLPAIDTSDCCVVNHEVLEQLDGIDAFTIEMLAGQPALRARFGRDVSLLVNLDSGWWYPSIDQEAALMQTDAYIAATGIRGESRFLAQINRDQWTVAGYFDVYRPLYLMSTGDEAGTRLYVSSVTGQVVQVTTSSERFWNWLGAVIHWIYPTALRQNVAVWSQVVIWLSIASLFLVIVGIYLGIQQFRFRGPGSRSPYRGLNLWHHYAGLLFGLVTVTWLFSGLLSMNPWGAFEGDAGSAERSRLAGGAVSAAELTDLVATLDATSLPAGTVRLRSSLIAGDLALIAEDREGNATRLETSELEPEPLAPAVWKRLPSLIRPAAPLAKAEFIRAGDAYYFDHHEKVSFPVYRLIFDDAEQTRYYLDATSGEIRQKIDSDRRWNRWLFHGLHRGDFTALMRQRPIWDLIMLPLMLGVTVAAVTGVWMAYRRITK